MVIMKIKDLPVWESIIETLEVMQDFPGLEKDLEEARLAFEYFLFLTFGWCSCILEIVYRITIINYYV